MIHLTVQAMTVEICTLQLLMQGDSVALLLQHMACYLAAGKVACVGRMSLRRATVSLDAAVWVSLAQVLAQGLHGCLAQEWYTSGQVLSRHEHCDDHTKWRNTLFFGWTIRPPGQYKRVVVGHEAHGQLAATDESSVVAPQHLHMAYVAARCLAIGPAVVEHSVVGCLHVCWLSQLKSWQFGSLLDGVGMHQDFIAVEQSLCGLSRINLSLIDQGLQGC